MGTIRTCGSKKSTKAKKCPRLQITLITQRILSCTLGRSPNSICTYMHCIVWRIQGHYKLMIQLCESQILASSRCIPSPPKDPKIRRRPDWGSKPKPPNLGVTCATEPLKPTENLGNSGTSPRSIPPIRRSSLCPRLGRRGAPACLLGAGRQA